MTSGLRWVTFGISFLQGVQEKLVGHCFFGLYCNLLEELKLHNPVVTTLQDLCILESRGGRRLIRGIRFVFIFFRIIFISFLFADLHFFGIIGVWWGGHFFILGGGDWR